MKELTLIQMKNKVEQLDQMLRQLYMELTYQRQINETLANVCRQLPDWETAVEVEKQRLEDEKNAQSEEVSPDAESALDLGPQEQEESQVQEEETQEPELKVVK